MTSDDPCHISGMISVEQAQDYLLERARPVVEDESVPVSRALGRVLSANVISPLDVPGHANSAMDGYAVRSADIEAGGVTRLRVVQRIAAGNTGVPLGAGEAARIFTGAPVPGGSDAVIMQEDCEADGDWVGVRGPVNIGEHIRPRGNDILAGTEILTRGMRIRPQEMGLAASVGLARLQVFQRVRVAIFSSGDELVQPGEALLPGCIYNSNRYMLMGLVERLGCDLVDLGTVEDSLPATERALREAARQADVVVTCGGVSVGEADHVKHALQRVGELRMWRVAVKPGKPLAYGHIGTADFLGLPGNPVSTLVTFCLFVRPFVLRRQGVAAPLARPVPARAGFEWTKPARRREFARARATVSECGHLEVELYANQGSDVLTSTVWADGLVEIPEGAILHPGDDVRYYSFSELLS